MLTSFFKKSKPINFLIVGIFISLYFILIHFFVSNEANSWQQILKNISYFIAYILIMVVLNFIVKRNEISKKNTFTILLFGLLTTLLIPVLKAEEIFVSAFFVMLALRRIISLKSGLEVKKKIFDASLWIAVASIFYPLSILFIILPYLGVFYYASQDFKNFFIPLVSVIGAYLLITTVYLLAIDAPFALSQYLITPDLNFIAYKEASFFIPLSIIGLFCLLSMFFFFKEIQHAVRKRKTMLYMVMLFFLIAIIIALLSPQKTGGELLLPLLGLSIIGTFFFEHKNHKWIKEIVLALLLLSVFIIPFFT